MYWIDIVDYFLSALVNINMMIEMHMEAKKNIKFEAEKGLQNIQHTFSIQKIKNVTRN